jgi:hypothetical protein
MANTLRLTEKWMHRGLWLVAFVFAGFLIGLGGTVVGDLPKVEKQLSLDDYMDANASTALRNAIKAADRAGQDAQTALEQAQLKRRAAQADSAAARETFDNWLSTRHATQQAEQDPNCCRARGRWMRSRTANARPAWPSRPSSRPRSMRARALRASAASSGRWKRPRKCCSTPNTGAWSCASFCTAWR